MSRADHVQFNIRSAYARAKAHELAKLTGMTMTQVVEEALRGYVPAGAPAAASRQVRRGPILVTRSGSKTISQAEADGALAAVRGDQAFPLERRVPNATTREAMAEASAIMAERRARARGIPES